MKDQELRVICEKVSPGTWSWQIKSVTSILPILKNDVVDWKALGTAVTEALQKHHPEYLGNVGTISGGTLPFDAAHLLQRVVIGIWERHSTWSPDEHAINELIQEFARFVDQPNIPVTYAAQLLNFSLDPRIDVVTLPEGMTIRQLNEKEFSQIYGGDPLLGAILPRARFIFSYAITGDYEIRKIVNEPLPQQLPNNELQKKLNRAMLALRTFKNGRVGYEAIDLKTRYFCPYLFVNRWGGNESVPWGGMYQLGTEEVQPFQEHANFVFSKLDPSLDMACSRLADAELRLQPRDSLVDAVIGLEAILLSNLPSDDRRGELRYRFSIHYSTLFESSTDRFRAFSRARDLYDLRSAIAHGAQVNENAVKVGNETISLGKAAETACEILRTVIKRFLPQGCKPAYKTAKYWDKAYFRLEGEDC
jgi:hypothetical protein